MRQSCPRVHSDRSAAERLEIAAPGVAATAVRLLGVLPAVLRRRATEAALERAAAAFNRGDFDALFALFADDVEYVPPPALRPPVRLTGRQAVIAFWRDVLERYPQSTITNLALVEVERNRFTRTARLVHRAAPDDELSYEIHQTTELRAGRVVRQVNEKLSGGESGADV